MFSVVERETNSNLHNMKGESYVLRKVRIMKGTDYERIHQLKQRNHPEDLQKIPKSSGNCGEANENYFEQI